MISTVPQSTHQPMSVRRSSAWARRPRVASNANPQRCRSIEDGRLVGRHVLHRQFVQLLG
jgi:hypothetical protein